MNKSNRQLKEYIFQEKKLEKYQHNLDKNEIFIKENKNIFINFLKINGQIPEKFVLDKSNMIEHYGSNQNIINRYNYLVNKNNHLENYNFFLNKKINNIKTLIKN